MYKPKYLTREFVVYRDPKLDPRSEMQAGGVVQREGFAKRGSAQIKDIQTKAVAELNQIIEYAINNRKVSGFDKPIIIDGKKFDSIPDLNEFAKFKKIKRDYLYEGLNITPKDARYKIYDDVIDLYNQNYKTINSQELANVTGGDRGAIKTAISKGYITSKPLPQEKLITNYVQHLIDTDAPISDFTFTNIAKHVSPDVDIKGAKANVYRQTVSKYIQKNLPDTYNVLSNELKNFGAFIDEYSSLQSIPFSEFKENYQNLRADRINASANLRNVRSQSRILEGKLKLDARSLAASNAQDNLVKSMNTFLKQPGNEELILNNPKFRELASIKVEKGQVIKLPIDSSEIDERLRRYINSGFFSTDHKVDKTSKKLNVEFPTNKQIVPSFTNSSIRGMETYIKNNMNLYNTDDVVKNNIDNFVKLAEQNNFTVRVPKGYSNVFGTRTNVGAYDKTPSVTGNKLTGYVNQLKNYGLDVEQIPEVQTNTVFTEIDPKDFQKTKQGLQKSLQGLQIREEKLDKIINSQFKNNPQLFQVAEASFGGGCRVKKSAGGRIPGEDYNACIARNFSATVGDVTSTDDAKRVKAMTKLMQMGRGAAKLGKGALKGLQAVLIGTGAGEIAATAVLEAAAPIYNYFEGEELERVFASAPILGFALSKIDPENFSDEALEKIVYGQGLTDEEIIDAEIVANQLRRYKKMTDLFRQRASLLEYEDQLISEGAQPGMVDDKIAEIDKQVAAEASEFAKEGNKITKERIMSFDKGIKNYAEETQFQKEKRFVNKYLTNPAADPMTPRDYIDRKKASLIGEFFGDLSPVDGPLYQIGQNLTPELRTIATPEVKDYYNFAEGGIVERKGFANGPKITRRGFLGAVAAIVASLKLGSFGQTGKKVTTEVGKKVIKNAPKGTPDWFAPLVDKVFKEGVDAGDTMKTVTTREVAKKLEVKNPETNTTETYFLYENPDTGEIRIDIDAPFLGANDGEFSLYMRPDRVDGVTDDGRPILEEGEFFVTEERAVGRSNGPDDFDIELETIDTDLSGSASDYHRVEEFATGKTDKKAQAEQLKKKDYIEKNPGDDIESRYGPYDDTPPDDYYD